jgi:hypothetical protein
VTRSPGRWINASMLAFAGMLSPAGQLQNEHRRALFLSHCCLPPRVHEWDLYEKHSTQRIRSTLNEEPRRVPVDCDPLPIGSQMTTHGH